MIPDDFLPTEPGPGRDEMLKFYLSSYEDILKEQDKFDDQYGPDIRARGPFFRWVDLQELKNLYENYKAGNKEVILTAIYVCSKNSFPLPRWCEMAFIKAYRDVRQYKSENWEDVFGKAHPKGTHIETKREEREYSFKIYRKIQQIIKENPKTPIDGNLFESVGREFAIGSKTKIETMYYKAKKILGKS